MQWKNDKTCFRPLPQPLTPPPRPCPTLAGLLTISGFSGGASGIFVGCIQQFFRTVFCQFVARISMGKTKVNIVQKQFESHLKDFERCKSTTYPELISNSSQKREIRRNHQNTIKQRNHTHTHEQIIRNIVKTSEKGSFKNICM